VCSKVSLAIQYQNTISLNDAFGNAVRFLAKIHNLLPRRAAHFISYTFADLNVMEERGDLTPGVQKSIDIRGKYVGANKVRQFYLEGRQVGQIDPSIYLPETVKVKEDQRIFFDLDQSCLPIKPIAANVPGG